MAISATSLSFDSVELNTVSSKTLTLTSSGSSALTVNSVSVAGAGFSVSGTNFPATVNPGQSLTLQVNFTPTTAGTASGTVTIASNSGGPTTVSLNGIGRRFSSRQLALSSTALSFGGVTLNTKSVRTLTLTSSGTATVNVSAVNVGGHGFSVSGGSFPAALDPGESLTLYVAFNPDAAGTANGTVTISSNSSTGSTSTVALTGTGTQATQPQLAVSATSLSFGTVTLNTGSRQTLTLTSSGTAALTVNSAKLTGTGFALSGATFPMTLNPGQSTTLQVSFDPTTAGAVTGSVTISSNSTSGATTTVSLSGTGTQPTTRQLTVSATSLAFGNITLKTVSTKTLTLTSSGTSAVTVNSAKVAGTGFALSGPTFPVTLNPGRSATLQVSFAPTTAGAVTGSVTISSNSTSGATTTVSLSGTGAQAATPQLTISATTLAFGNINLNILSTKVLTLTSSGTAALTVSSAKVAGSGFTLTGATFPATLNPGQSLTLQIGFTPITAGAVAGTVTIASNSTSGATSTVALSGTGVQASNAVLTLSSTSLSFGDVPLGTPDTLALTLTSTGTSPVTVSAASITGTGFTFTGATFPVTLNSNVAVTIQVKFDPTVTGAASGKLTFTSNSTKGSTSTVTLTGNGASAQHQVTLSWTAPTSSPVQVSGYHIYRAAGGSTSFKLVTPSINSQVTYVDQTVASSTTYAYYVTSVDSTGAESAPSNQITMTIPQ